MSSQAIDARRSNAMRKLGTENIPQLTEFMIRLRDSPGAPSQPARPSAL